LLLLTVFVTRDGDKKADEEEGNLIDGEEDLDKEPLLPVSL